MTKRLMLRGVLTSVLLAVLAAPAAAATLAELTGNWSGSLTNRHGAAAPIILHVMADGTGSVDSPAQGAFGVPVTDLKVEHNVISFKVPRAEARYQGMLAGDRSAIDGHWIRGDHDLPLTLIYRPETPAP